MAINCPKCESDNVQSLSMIHADGTSEINTRTVGGGGTRGGLGGGVAHTRGTQQSALAKKANPPAKKHPILMVVGMSLLGFILGLILEFPVGQFATFLAWGGLTFWGVKMAISANNWNKNEWPQLKEAWDHSWMCMKCGNLFEQRL